VVVAGDLNDFEYSTTVQTLVGAGLTDLPATLPDSERYTYVFEGNSQVLDHILLSPALVNAGYAYDVVHTNAELAAPLSDHDRRVPAKRLRSKPAHQARRANHDQALIHRSSHRRIVDHMIDYSGLGTGSVD